MFEEPNTIPTEDDMNAMYEAYSPETQRLIDGLKEFTDAANDYADSAVTHLAHMTTTVEGQDALLTQMAVGEAIQVASHQRGHVGPMPFTVSRMREVRI